MVPILYKYVSVYMNYLHYIYVIQTACTQPHGRNFVVKCGGDSLV